MEKYLAYITFPDEIYHLDSGYSHFNLPKLIEMMGNQYETTTEMILLVGHNCNSDMLMWDIAETGGLFFINSIKKYKSSHIDADEAYLIEFDEHGCRTKTQKFVRR